MEVPSLYNYHIALGNQHLHCMECIRKDTKGKWLYRLLDFVLAVHIPTAIISCFVLWRWQIEDWGTWHVILCKHLLKMFVVNNYLILFFKWMWMQMHDWHVLASRGKMQMDLHCIHFIKAILNQLCCTEVQKYQPSHTQKAWMM